MTIIRDLREPVWLRRVAPAASGFAIGTGLLALIGYASRERTLVAVLPGSVPMAANTAALFMLTGAGLWLVSPPAAGVARRRAGQCLAVLVVLVAAAILAQYVLGHSLGIDQILFGDRAREWSTSATPGRLSPQTGVGFMVVGSAMAVLDTDAGRGYRYARMLALAAALIAGIGLTGRGFGLQSVYGSSRVHRMAVPTAMNFVMISAGLLACRVDRPLARLFAGEGLGGATMRRLTPVVTAAVLLAGILFAATQNTTIPLAGFGVTVVVMILVMTVCVVVVRTGRALNEVDREYQSLLASLRDEHSFNDAMLQSLPDGVIAIAPDGTVLKVSRRWCEITGFSEQETVGLPAPYPWWLPERAAQSAAETAAGEHPSTSETRIQLRRADGAVLEIVRSIHPVLGADGGLRMTVETVRDVTELNQAESEQRYHAEQLTHYFQLSADLMCIAGTDGYFKRLNPAWEQALGYTEAELTSRPYVEFVHPDDVAHTTAENDSQTDFGRASISFENRYRCRDGSYRWLQWNAMPQGDLIYAVARDTTAYRQAAADQARLAAIVDSTDDAIISKTLDGIITSWNPAAERIYGLRADEAIGRSIRTVFGNEHDEILQGAGRGESVTGLESVRVRADGTSVHIGLTVSPIWDSNGIIVGAASITRDTTASYKAEERFRRLLQGAPEAMMIFDTAGKVVLANAQAERLFGYPAADLIGQPVEMLMPAAVRARHLNHRADYLRSPSVRGMGTEMDLSGLRRDGTEFPVEISLAPLDTDQGALVSAAIRDVTARRQTERDLAAARDEALAAAQVKSKFVAMVSHEIRTPMNGVIGLAALLMNTPLEPTQRRYVEAIRASGQALLSIINDILDFSKIEYGKIDLRESDFALDKLIEDVVQVAAEAGRDKDLPVQAYYPPRMPTRVHGDEGRLRQVLLNLLANAVKFTEDGEVLLRADPVDDDTRQPPRFTFTVADSGIGIAAPDIAAIFQPFSQVDGATSREFGGTGLGLAICDQLVRLMGGRLDVTSEPGEGSRFTFTIPLKPPADDSAPHLPSSNALTGRRLIVVDGNDARRVMMAEHCTAWGLHTDTATDGESALAALREATSHGRPYDVAVLDQRLPGVEGAELARQVTADPEISNLSLILLTSGSHRDERVAIDAGATTALPKPVGPSQLFNGLFELLGPLVEVPAHSAAGQPVDTTDHGLILLAEDNAINRLVAVDTLETLGYRVDVARNGVEALALAAAHTYQAVLMDCQMPKMDGFAATAALRDREGAGAHIPIIAMTAGALSEDRERCLAAGMDDYLAKPIDPDELSAALQRWTTDHQRAGVDT